MKTPALSRLSICRTPRISSPFQSGTPSVAPDLRSHERLGLPHLGGRVRGEDRGALAHDLAEDAARDGDGLLRGPLLPAHARDDRDVADRALAPALVVVLAQDDGDVRGPRHEPEGRVADRDEHGRADRPRPRCASARRRARGGGWSSRSTVDSARPSSSILRIARTRGSPSASARIVTATCTTRSPPPSSSTSPASSATSRAFASSSAMRAPARTTAVPLVDRRSRST